MAEFKLFGPQAGPKLQCEKLCASGQASKSHHQSVRAPNRPLLLHTLTNPHSSVLGKRWRRPRRWGRVVLEEVAQRKLPRQRTVRAINCANLAS